MVEIDYINVRFACHVCKLKSFSERTKLRKHLLLEEEIEIEPRKLGKRSIDTNVVHVKSSEIKVYEEKDDIVKMYYGCAVCPDYFVQLDDYTDHINKEHLGMLDDDYDLVASGPLPSTIILPNSTIADTDEQVSVKKSKTTTEAITRLYSFQARNDNLTTTASTQTRMIGGIIESIDLEAYTMYTEDGDECYSLTTKDHMPTVIQTCAKKGIRIVPCKTPEEKPANPFEKHVTIDDEYLEYMILTRKINTKPLLNNTFKEINDVQLSIINQDWNGNEYFCAVCAQMLAGCILVNNDEVLFVNCIEIYNRFRHLDTHAERHSIQKSSLPDGTELYDGLKICNMDSDSSHKLVLGSHVISALVTSSLRLDLDQPKPELGPSTHSFHPTQNTRLFLSAYSLHKSDNLLKMKSTQINTFDKYAQLKQIRSKYTVPSTYRLSRCSLRITDNNFSRPYTVFTVYTMEYGDQFGDLKLGSRILRLMASTVFEGKRSINRADLKKIVPVKKDTSVYHNYQKILELDAENDEILFLGNQNLERILVSIAEKITPQLKEANSKVEKKILEKTRK
ncbi:hypothetical protein BDF21DRAFT_389426 [Thamnidium elegans]|nr:hypothetical protein BDF21DRAFT_389426 [Thamnidium elegans]